VTKSRLAGAAVVLALFIACAGDEVRQISQRGESCERHADCDSGLACRGGVCTIGSFDVPATGSECVLIECDRDADCCGESATCTSYRQYCDQGISSYCDQALVACACNQRCENNLCRATCDENTPCPSGRYCEGGQCVQCQCDAHCAVGSVCRDALCVAECVRDADCGYFERCRNNQCVDVGCQTDRECVALMRSVLAFCDAGACRERCSTDLECGSGEAFSFNACVEGTCRDVGCESAEECRAYYLRLGMHNPKTACQPRRAPPAPGITGVGGTECPPVPCNDTCDYALNGVCNDPGVCAPGTDCTDCACGNGRIDTGEQCDGANFGGATCQVVLDDPTATGTLACSPNCQILSYDCYSTQYCGDYYAEGSEECDGTDLRGQNCNSVTFGALPSGTLYCTSWCQFDTSACTSDPGYCGDGIAQASEECDGSDLKGETCSSLSGGTLTGTLLCSFCSFDTSACTTPGYCGDGIVQVGEQCDTFAFNGETCSSMTGGRRPFGSLFCSSCTIDTSSCYCQDTCASAEDGVCDDPGDCAPGTDCSDCCNDTCEYANNGVCDEPTLCAPGTDCNDCEG
jgi:hypothetical protein